MSRSWVKGVRGGVVLGVLVAGGAPSVGCGGTQSGVDGTGGAATGGVTGGTGGAATGGTVATGGATTTGGAGTGGAGTGGSGTDKTPVPSEGCGVTGSVTGARTVEIQGDQGAYHVTIPSDYDADTPYPIGFAFHGFGRTHDNCRQGDCAGFQSVMQEEAILVYLKSFGEGWEGAEREQNVEFFETVLDTLEDEFCVDERREFVAGTSSGAHFTNILGCRFGDRLRAIAPVAGYLPESENCVDRVAAVVIHGIDDPHVTFDSGEEARDFFLEQNGCSETTVPDLATAHQEVRTARDGDDEIERCVDYQGCDDGVPVRWCEHSYGGYDDSTHGWPPTGGQMIWDFVQDL